MAFSNRPYGDDGSGVVRKFFRPANSDFRSNKRAIKQAPPEATNAESFYYVKQMQGKTPMVFVLRDGETLHGVIEWYDKCCLKVNRTDEPNILLYKPCIKYIYKDKET